MFVLSGQDSRQRDFFGRVLPNLWSRCQIALAMDSGGPPSKRQRQSAGRLVNHPEPPRDSAAHTFWLPTVDHFYPDEPDSDDKDPPPELHQAAMTADAAVKAELKRTSTSRALLIKCQTQPHAATEDEKSSVPLHFERWTTSQSILAPLCAQRRHALRRAGFPAIPCYQCYWCKKRNRGGFYENYTGIPMS